MAAPLTCPYCNSTITLPGGVHAGQTVVCSRCGDAFTVPSSYSNSTAPPGAGSEPDEAGAGEYEPFGRRTSNRAVAGIILAIMGCMAAVGLAYALLTVKDRRAHDSGIPGKPRHAPPVRPEPMVPLPLPTAPDKLEALGYLPADTGLILAANVEELRSSPVGSRLLTEGFRAGKWDVRPEALIRWTGLRPQEIDHIVLGLRLDDSIPPCFWLIAHTNDRLDADQLSDRLKAQRVPGTEPRLVYRYSVPGVSLPLNFTCANDRTLVIALLPSFLTEIPATPYADVSQLGSELRNVIRNRREVGAVLWLAAHAQTWPRIAGQPLFEGMKRDELERIKRIKTVGLWVQIEETGGIRMRGDFHCKDRPAAAALDELFQGPHHAAKVSTKTALDGAWVSLQMQADLATLQEVLAALP